MNIKTPIIVLAALIALASCIFIAVNLLSADVDINETETNLPSNEMLVLRAIDGDTLELSSGETVRLLCVDTPEEGKEGYEEAGNYLSSLILVGEENLRIERQGTDMYNRTLAWVYLSSGNTLVNKEIIDNGYGSLFEYNGTDCGRVK